MNFKSSEEFQQIVLAELLNIFIFWDFLRDDFNLFSVKQLKKKSIITVFYQLAALWLFSDFKIVLNTIDFYTE